MLTNITLLNYIITGSLFISGFFVSRVFIKANLPTIILIKFLKISGGKFTKLILIIMLTSALLSAFIPNMITVLTLLPIISLLNKKISNFALKPNEFSTPLIIPLIYGANIGGIISITGSPANALLIGYLPILQHKYNIHFIGIEKINFFSWLAFGLPIALILILIGWLIIILFTVSPNKKKTLLPLNKIKHTHNKKGLEHLAVFILLINLLYWTLISITQILFKQTMIYLTMLSLLFTIAFIFFIFFIKVNHNDSIKKPILQFKDSYSGLPKKGLIFLLIAVILAILFMVFNVPKFVLSNLNNFTIIKSLPLILIFFAFALLTTFLTEIFSNSVVALTILPIATIIAIDLRFEVLPLLFLVSFSTTCAFMSPIATPVNAFAFGSLKHVSLKKMFFTGFIMNVISSFVLGLSAFYFLPLFFT